VVRAYQLAAFLFVVPSAVSQQLPCRHVIPVNVVLPNWGLVRHLSADGLVARNKKDPIPILSLTTDSGPRRIVFVLENGRPMPAAARKIESEVVSDILSNARAEDSFALLTARGPREKIGFGATHDALKATAEELGNPSQRKSDGDGVLDALLEATTWFQQPQAGDSIILMTMGLESHHKVRYAKVRTAVADGRIRVFILLLGQFVVGFDSSGVAFAADGPPRFTEDVLPNLENVLALGICSGGAVAQEKTDDPMRRYTLTDHRLRRLKNVGEQMYKAITECYLAELNCPSRNLVIDLADPIRKRLPKAMILYPRLLPRCSPAVRNKSNP
jgi:hypothetical protein